MTNQQVKIIGCGYIGKKIAAMLLEQNITPRCFVHSQASMEACESLDLPVQRCELDDDKVFSDNTESFEKASLMYLAPPPPRGREDSRMSHFLHYLETREATPAKIVLVSTTGIYGDCNGEWIDESHPINPQADRAYRRVDAERQLNGYCEKNSIPLVIFRVPGIYAADKLPIKRITSGEPIVRAEDSGFTNRVHAHDLAAFCVEALTSDVERGAYNCCDGQPSTMNDYFMKVADAKGVDRPAEISLEQAREVLSAGMLSYLAESKRISNEKLLSNFKTRFTYENLQAGLKEVRKGK